MTIFSQTVFGRFLTTGRYYVVAFLGSVGEGVFPIFIYVPPPHEKYLCTPHIFLAKLLMPADFRGNCGPIFYISTQKSIEMCHNFYYIDLTQMEKSQKSF